MKLMQWLAVGRSLGKVRDDRNRYKLSEQGLLPRFGPTGTAAEARRRNSPSSATAPAATATAITAVNERNAMTTVEVDAGEAGVSAGASLVGGAAAGGGSATARESLPDHKFPLGRWTVFRNPFVKSAKSARSAKAASQVRAPVQGELLLDLVKPVRNDLADSDLVVVAGRAADKVGLTPATATATAMAAAAGTPEAAVESGATVAEPVWSRIKTQFFGAEKE